MKDVLGTVFKGTKSKILAVVSMVVVYDIVSYIPNAKVLGQVFSSDVSFGEKMLFALTLLGTPFANTTTLGFVLLLISVFLSGIVIALGVYAFRQHAENVNAFGLSGLGMVSTFIGIGCASCGSLFLSALIPILGIGTLSFLPFGGLEFSVLGIVLLLVSIHQIVRQIQKPATCKVQ